jgi:hypothetical protein
MDSPKNDGLVIFVGQPGSATKRSEVSATAPAARRGIAMQMELVDPPEYEVTCSGQQVIEPLHPVGGTRMFIGGVPLDEHERREALPRRTLVASDIPNESWREHYAGYELREDGAIVSPNVPFELGWVRSVSGTVDWVRI